MFELLELFDSSPEAISAWKELNESLANVTTPCSGKPDDYADNSIKISIDKAEEMCYNCPIIKQCYDYAVAANVTAGIWGGIHFDTIEEALFESE